MVAVVGVNLALAVFVPLIPVALLVIATLVCLRVLLLGLTIWLALLLGLIHGIEDAKVMFGMLEECFRSHPVAAAGRVAPKLKVFFEQLLGGAADADFRPVTVENVVSIKRNSAA